MTARRTDDHPRWRQARLRHSTIALVLPLAMHGASRTDTLTKATQAVFVEALGSAGLGSMNYERSLLNAGRVNVGARIGVGTIHLRNFEQRFDPDLIVPVGVFATWGGRFRAEIGGGAAITSITYPDPVTFEPARRAEVQAWSSIGFRFSNPGGGVLFRFAYTPLWEFGNLRHWGGVSFGYSF